MAIDTSIYGNIRQPEFESPVNALAKVTQLQNAQSQNRLAQLTLADKQRETEGDNALAGLLASGGDSASVAKGLAQQGFGAKSLAYSKQAAEMAKQQREAEKAQLESAIQKQGIIAQYAGSAKDQPSWTAAKQALAGMGVDVSQVPDQYDPATAQTLLQRSLTGVQQLEQTWKAKQFDLDVAKFGYQQSNDAENRGVTIRGQNMTDARSREANQSGKAPAGYRFKPDGSLEVIPGGPADGKGGGKPLTEGQSKAALFGTRMQEADKIINGLSAEGINNSVPGSRAPIIGGIVTALSPAKRQQLDQAKRDFINATLRRESGAVISPEEFDNGEKQYFPQPGNPPEVIAQKARNRAIATRGILAEVPESRRADMVKEIVGDTPPASGGVIDFGSLK